MANYAHVLDGIVQNVYGGISDPAAELQALHDAGVLFECSNLVERSWSYNGSEFSPPPSPPDPTVRQKRREAYFSALRVESGDDQITVLGDQVDKILAQVGLMKGILDILVQQLANVSPEIRRSESFAALLAAGAAGTITPELAALAAKIQAIKVAIPKAG